MKNRLAFTLSAILLIAVGGFFGWNTRIYFASKTRIDSGLTQIRENSPLYHFINPLLLVDNSEASAKYNNIKYSVTTYADSAKKQKKAADISIYFRDLNLGRWTGVDENKLYEPSSLLKVAVMVGYLNEANSDPNILTKKIIYNDLIDSYGQHYPPDFKLQNGPQKVQELIKDMIIYSDNNAMVSLYNNNPKVFVEFLKDLDIDLPPSTYSEENIMSPKSYSSIFRTLFSSTYLTRESSELALKLLADTTFKKGLVAGVPSDIVVSHKFGEHTNLKGKLGVVNQLHDCGIIYYPEHPFLLCVMTRGSDFNNLETIISDISKIVYSGVEKIYH